MPTPASSTELVPLGDSHSIKFSGAGAGETAREFFAVPLQLPRGEFSVYKEGGEIHVQGIKSAITRYKFSGMSPDPEFGPGEVRFTVGATTLVIHTTAGEERPGSFPLVKKLVPVADQVAEFHRLKGLSYRPGDEEKKAEDLEKLKALLQQIQKAYSAPELPARPANKAPDADPDEDRRRVAARPPPPARPPRQAPAPSYSPPTSSFSRSSG